MYRIFVYIFTVFILSINGYAQTVTWSTPPTYKSLEEYTEGLYKMREKGKVGLVEISGKVVVSANYDSITPFFEHLALALEYDGGKYSVKGIVNQHNYVMTKITDKYYVTDEYPFFSEGKLVIYDSNNKYGYLQTDGSLFKNCQYMKAYPFYCGRACVQLGEKKIKYLKNNGEELTTQLESDTYILLAGTSFNEKEEAFVQGEATGKGVKRWVINTDGRNIREAKLSGKILKNYNSRELLSHPTMLASALPLDGINPYQKDGLYGFSNGKNGIILPPQFTESTPFRSGYAKVKKDGKYGILHLQSGTFHGQLTKNDIKIENGKSETIKYSVSMPSAYANIPVVMQMKQDKNVSQVLQPIASDHYSKSYLLIPTPQNKEKEIYYHFSIQTDNLYLWEDEQRISLEYVTRPLLILSVPQIGNEFKTDKDGYTRADKDNKIEVFAIVENKSSDAFSVIVTIYGNGVEKETKSLSIAAGSYAKISSYIKNIKERKLVEVIVETTTGLKKNSSIKIKPFI